MESLSCSSVQEVHHGLCIDAVAAGSAPVEGDDIDEFADELVIVGGGWEGEGVG